jgi:hypothetical protein
MTARLDVNRVDLGFDVKALTIGASATDQHIEPTAVALPGTGLLIAYQNGASGNTNTDVKMKRATTFAALSASGPEADVVTTSVSDDSPLAVVANSDTLIFLSYQQTASNPHWMYRRYRYLTDTFPENAPQQLSTVVPTVRDLHAAAAGGMVWTAFGDGVNVQVVRLNAAANTTDSATISNVGPAAGGSNFFPFVLALSATEALVFYTDLLNTPKGLRVAAFTNGTTNAPVITVIPGSDEQETSPSAVQDADGNIFLFSSRPVPAANNDIIMRRRNVASTDWGQAQRVSPNAANDIRPHAVFVPGSGVWLFWMSDRIGNSDVYAKRIVTAI